MIVVMMIVGCSPPEVACETDVALNRMESKNNGTPSLTTVISRVCFESASFGDTKKVVNELFCDKRGMNIPGVWPSIEYVEIGG